MCSAHTWEKLSKEQQEMIKLCAQESAIYERKLWVEQENISMEQAIRSGVTVITLDSEEKEKFHDAMERVYDSYCGEYKDWIEMINRLKND